MANVDSETGQILYGGYLFEVAGIDDLYYSETYCFDGEHFTFPRLYTEIDWNDPPGAYFTGSNAKEIADSVFTDDMRTWADALSSGGRFLVIWNSPYGICAYTHTRDEYADGPDGLGYMLNEDAILDMCRSIGLDRALIPESSREN